MTIDIEMATDELQRRANSIELEISKAESTIPAPHQDEPVQEAIDPKYLELLAKLGFTEIPTAEQVKAKLDARRAEIRSAVMEQADARGWCDDGTRQVCADLRLTRPGTRQRYTVKVPVTFEMEMAASAFTPETALAFVKRQITQGSDNDYIRRGFGASAVSNFAMSGDPVVTDADGNPVEIETPGGAA